VLGLACNIKCCDAPLEFLLQNGANPLLPAYEGETALHVAADRGRLSKCRLLIEAEKRTLEMRDCDGRDPLCIAVLAGHSDIVQLFEDSGADIHTRDKVGTTLLHCAAESPETRLAVLLHLLLSTGLRPNVANNEGVTPLHLAAAGNKAAVQLLLKHGADPAAVANDGYTTVLLAAVKSGRADLVKLLLDSGLGLEALAASKAYKEGITPLMVACAKNNPAVTRLLLERGADVNEGRSAGCVLYTAALLGKGAEGKQCMELLLDAGADVRAATAEGTTVWHAAAGNKSPRALQLLLEHGGAADLIDAPAQQCECCGLVTPLMRCEQQTHIKLLLAAGADPLRTTDKGDTYLHVAIRHGYAVPALCLLMKAGVDVHAVNHQGQTAAELADMCGHELAAALLRRVAAKGV
jgi:ankyrin repeat protein